MSADSSSAKNLTLKPAHVKNSAAPERVSADFRRRSLTQEIKGLKQDKKSGSKTNTERGGKKRKNKHGSHKNSSHKQSSKEVSENSKTLGKKKLQSSQSNESLERESPPIIHI